MQYDVFIESGSITFVLTDSSRADMWSRDPGHAGITQDEVDQLGGATNGRAVGREMLDAIARVKQAMPGAVVTGARNTEGRADGDL